MKALMDGQEPPPGTTTKTTVKTTANVCLTQDEKKRLLSGIDEHYLPLSMIVLGINRSCSLR
jgi:hypothetical protein